MGLQQQQPPLLGCLNLSYNWSQLCQAGACRWTSLLCSRAQAGLQHTCHACSAVQAYVCLSAQHLPLQEPHSICFTKGSTLDVCLLLCSMCLNWPHHTRPARDSIPPAPTKPHTCHNAVQAYFRLTLEQAAPPVPAQSPSSTPAMRPLLRSVDSNSPRRAASCCSCPPCEMASCCCSCRILACRSLYCTPCRRPPPRPPPPCGFAAQLWMP